MVDRSAYDATYQIRSRSLNREKETVMYVPWVRWIAFTALFYSVSFLYAPALHAELIDLFDPNGVSPDDPQFFQLIGVENRVVHVQALQDVRLTQLGAIIQPTGGLTEVGPSAYWSVWRADANGNLLGTSDNSGRIFFDAVSYTDEGLGTYFSHSFDLSLQKNEFYVIVFQVNFDALMPLYRESLQDLPLLTSDGSLLVINGGTLLDLTKPILPAFRANVVPILPPDSDRDGVHDDADNCPGTPAGEVVNASGCSIDQLCPCEQQWKNHGRYSSCVENAAEDFAAAGLITEDERGAIVAEAEQSSCGKKK
jgi:hypothetical protein